MSTQAVTIVDTKPIETKLELLKKNAEAIQVVDAQTYALACHIAVDVRTEVKAIGFALDPGIESAKRHLEELRSQKMTFIARLNPIIEIATRKAEFWKSEERKKAQAEQDRINEQRRKEAAEVAERERKEAIARAEQERKEKEKFLKTVQRSGEMGKREAEKIKKEIEKTEAIQKQQAEENARIAAANVQEVKVAPAVPKVAGIKARVNWKFTIKNENLIPRVFLRADEVAIGAMVRNTKDKAKAEAKCPGIEVTEEDSV